LLEAPTTGSYRPTVLAEVPLEARAYQEEIFGPVAPVVAFGDIEEAARLAAGTEYGLSLAILTTDVMEGLALAERIPVGMVHINDQTSTDEPIAPFWRHGRLRKRIPHRRSASEP
jgi:benzaldehyde dehydrogenase (NAD)